jgi:HSP20 family protein
MAHNLARFDPFAELDVLQRRFFEDGFLAPFRGMKIPATDVYTEDDKQLTVEAHLPGFQEKDISIDLDSGAIIIQAERHEKEEDKNKKYVVHESSNSYYRRVALPEQADTANIKAEFEHGVLKVVVPFNPSSTPVKIPITAGGSAEK